MPREATIVAKLMAVFPRYGGHCLKIHTGAAYCRVGEPDIIGCCKGRTVVIESKSKPGMKLDSIQLHRLAAWERSGAVVLRNPSVAELEQVLSSL